MVQLVSQMYFYMRRKHLRRGRLILTNGKQFVIEYTARSLDLTNPEGRKQIWTMKSFPYYSYIRLKLLSHHKSKDDVSLILILYHYVDP